MNKGECIIWNQGVKLSFRIQGENHFSERVSVMNSYMNEI